MVVVSPLLRAATGVCWLPVVGDGATGVGARVAALGAEVAAGPTFVVSTGAGFDAFVLHPILANTMFVRMMRTRLSAIARTVRCVDLSMQSRDVSRAARGRDHTRRVGTGGIGQYVELRATFLAPRHAC